MGCLLLFGVLLLSGAAWALIGMAKAIVQFPARLLAMAFNRRMLLLPLNMPLAVKASRDRPSIDRLHFAAVQMALYMPPGRVIREAVTAPELLTTSVWLGHILKRMRG